MYILKSIIEGILISFLIWNCFSFFVMFIDFSMNGKRIQKVNKYTGKTYKITKKEFFKIMFSYPVDLWLGTYDK